VFDAAKMVGMVAMAPLSNSSIERQQQATAYSRLGNPRNPDLCTARFLDSPRTDSLGSAPHNLPLDTHSQDPRSDNLIQDWQIDNNNKSISNGEEQLSDSFSDDCDNRNGDLGSWSPPLGVLISCSYDSGDRTDSDANSDNAKSNDDVHSNSIQSYSCKSQAFRTSKRSYGILDVRTCNSDFDSSQHRLLRTYDTKSDTCDQRSKHRERHLRKITGSSKNIAVKAKWYSDPIRVYHIEAQQLPSLWRLYTPLTYNPHLSPELFRRQYSRKCDAGDITQTPLILSTMRKSSKVYASMIRRDPDRDEFTEVGPQIVIPVNYPGKCS
jgi:hypothetical protein